MYKQYCVELHYRHKNMKYLHTILFKKQSKIYLLKLHDRTTHTLSKLNQKNFLTLNPLSAKFVGNSRQIVRVYWTILWVAAYRVKMESMFISKERCTSNLADMDASQMHLWEVPYRVLETSQRGLICKSLRRLPRDWLKTSPQRRLWDLLGFLRDVFELHLRL